VRGLQSNDQEEAVQTAPGETRSIRDMTDFRARQQDKNDPSHALFWDQSI